MKHPILHREVRKDVAFGALFVALAGFFFSYVSATAQQSPIEALLAAM